MHVTCVCISRFIAKLHRNFDPNWIQNDLCSVGIFLMCESELKQMKAKKLKKWILESDNEL